MPGVGEDLVCVPDLGLSIVKHIVAAQGGSVDVQSTLGEGNTFIIRLPEA